METNEDVKALLDKVAAGDFDFISGQLEGGDLGIFYPAHVNNGVLKFIDPGYSQTEKDLKITISPTLLNDPDSKTIAWMGNKGDSYSTCNHPKTGPASCKHQNGHGDCIHCGGHPKSFGGNQFEGLDYRSAIEQLNDKQTILDTLAPQNLGLTLLHAHSDEFEFTKLPDGVVSVIADGVTSFREMNDVLNDETFTPNAWRFVDGKPVIAGGFSMKS